MQAITIRRPAVVASALIFAATLAVAGTTRAAGPQHGHSGPPAAGGFVEHVLAPLKDKLALDSSQQQMFDNARAQTIAARDQAMSQRSGVRTQVDAELAKSEPDLAAIAALLDGTQDQGRAARQQVRDQWLKFYANLRPDQKGIVRDAIRDRLAHAEGGRDRNRQRTQRAPT
ncbi:MAG: periplasmic heavy metal sensor [Betaproteobacteria bacterium]